MSYLNRVITFDDGTTLKVIQVKNRDGIDWVTYEVTAPNAIPKRHTRPMYEFTDNFDHLYNGERP